MGVLVGESPNTSGFPGVTDLEAGSMGQLCCIPGTGVYSGLPLLCAVHVELEINPPGNRPNSFMARQKKKKSWSLESSLMIHQACRHPCLEEWEAWSERGQSRLG